MALVSVLLVDDIPLVRLGLRTALCESTGMSVIGEADDGGQAVDLCRRLKPDVVLMDVRMPGMDGIEALSRLRGPGGCPDTKIVMFTVFDHDEYLFDALRLGASGFLVKDSPASVIVAALKAAHAGEALLSTNVTARLIRAYITSRPRGTDEVMPEQLTEREYEVLQLVVSGMHNEEIAERLAIGYTTVKSHIRRLLEKLGCRDRAQLVIYGYEHGVARWR